MTRIVSTKMNHHIQKKKLKGVVMIRIMVCKYVHAVTVLTNSGNTNPVQNVIQNVKKKNEVGEGVGIFPSTKASDI